MARKLRPDWVLFVITLSLVIFGIVMVFSSSAVLAKADYGNPNYFSFKQIVAAVFGLALMFVVMKVDYHLYKKPAVVFTVLSVTIALLVVVFFLPKHAYTYRWIQFSSVSFQPSELAKLALVFFLAYFLDKRAGQINKLQFTLAPIAIIVGMFAFLIVKEPDLGTAVALVLTTSVLLYVAGLDLRWFAVPVALSVPLFYVLVYRSNYRWSRIMAFLHPDDDPLGIAYNIKQSLLSGEFSVWGTWKENRSSSFSPRRTRISFLQSSEKSSDSSGHAPCCCCFQFFYGGDCALPRRRRIPSGSILRSASRWWCASRPSST